ncbi:hypothetical protein RJ639_012253 [Escallonia herrerae]|uniref:CCHC-type domain-containing protein n=1 Tax=Escallonia herrerae TaxID=1293975 RepID=A0AA89APF4_9ASTE|nr:hypothetical protein RJ639_012253 [Escallonia herrerae]
MAVQGWPTQPSLENVENLLANQESLAKQLAGVSLKSNEEAFFSKKRKDRFNRQRDKLGSKDKYGWHKFSDDQERSSKGGASQSRNKAERHRQRSDKCFNCDKKGHFARDSRYKKRSVEGNAATLTDYEEGVNNEEEWDAQASVAISERINKEEDKIDFDQRDTKDLNNVHKIAKDNVIEQALTATFPEEVDYINDWIVDSRNHMTVDKENLKSMSEYKGDRVVVTTNNSRLAIAHVGKAKIVPRWKSESVHANTKETSPQNGLVNHKEQSPGAAKDNPRPIQLKSVRSKPPSFSPNKSKSNEGEVLVPAGERSDYSLPGKNLVEKMGCINNENGLSEEEENEKRYMQVERNLAK